MSHSWLPSLLCLFASGSFVCTVCEGDSPISHEELTSSGKRKAPGGLPDHELKVYLNCFAEFLKVVFFFFFKICPDNSQTKCYFR